MFEIIRRDPFGRTAIRDLMNFIGNDPFFPAPSLEAIDEGTLALDVSEGEGEVIVRASLPGFRKDDIDVEIDNGVLTIKAEQSEEKESRDEKFYRRERRFGSVFRRVALPGVISEAGTKAELKEGVLTLHIPQAEEARPKRIAIK
jgi:HSP20 family protein